MRILFTTDYYYPHGGGGTETVVRRIAEGLAARGHEIHVATLNTRHAPPHEMLAGVEVHRFATLDFPAPLHLQLSISASF